MVKIVQRDAPVLRLIAKEVPLGDIGTPTMKKLIADLKKGVESQDDGVAIAAPQIDVSLRVFLVSGAVISKVEGEKIDDIIAINPVILKQSKDKKLMEEGCLSVRYLYGKIRRSTRVTIKYYDENGMPQTRDASGLLAEVFQHEIDHLNGILFIDNAKEVRDMADEHKDDK